MSTSSSELTNTTCLMADSDTEAVATVESRADNDPTSSVDVPNTSTSSEVSQGQQLSKRAIKMMKRAQQKQRYKENKQKNKPLTRNPNPGFDRFAETEYYFENGLRKVYPYHFEFSTYAKGRWQGRTLLDVFTEEFPFSTSAQREKIETGQIKVNEEIMSLDYKLKNKDLITNRLHRHENAVVDTPLEIIENNEDVVVINKPASIPVHPCGRYRYNSINFILGKEYGMTNLRSFYRLDRMTSGVLIIPKNATSTRKYMDALHQQSVQKEYVCRVVGEFPEKEVLVDQPIGILSHRLGAMRVRQDGKTAQTTFQRLSFNGKTSVVKCIPHTGRTHQIRVHLQFLGHPIVNDSLYNSTAFGPDRGKGGVFDISQQELYDCLKEEHNTGLWIADKDNPDFHKRIAELKNSKSSESSSCECLGEKPEEKSEIPDTKTSIDTEFAGDQEICKSESSETEPESKRPKLNDSDWCKTSESIQESKMQESEKGGSDSHRKRPGFDWNKWFPDENCPDCKMQFIDPVPKFLIMYLHALKYKGPDWEYETSMPDWAREDWVDPEESEGSR